MPSIVFRRKICQSCQRTYDESEDAERSHTMQRLSRRYRCSLSSLLVPLFLIPQIEYTRKFGAHVPGSSGQGVSHVNSHSNSTDPSLLYDCPFGTKHGYDSLFP